MLSELWRNVSRSSPISYSSGMKLGLDSLDGALSIVGAQQWEPQQFWSGSLRIPRTGKHIRNRRRHLTSEHGSGDMTLLETRLLANPDKARLRVYQTNSTHKSMSCLRQGSMVLVRDPDFHTVEEQFHEAIFTHASTSPNQQIIASLDVARRQMDLEGYELVNRAIQLAWIYVGKLTPIP